MARSRGPAATAVLAAALAGVCVLAGCGVGGAAALAPTPPGATDVPGGGSSTGPSVDDDVGTPVPTTVPVQAAVPVAAAAMAAYTDHGKTAAGWYAALAPHLSAAARAAYAGTDPATVPAHALTGPPTLQPASSAYLATVTQATDAGAYTVLCSRADDGSWQVERITPPAR